MWANIICYRDNKGNAAQKEGQEELKFSSEANLFYVLCHLKRKKVLGPDEPLTKITMLLSYGI